MLRRVRGNEGGGFANLDRSKRRGALPDPALILLTPPPPPPNPPTAGSRATRAQGRIGSFVSKLDAVHDGLKDRILRSSNTDAERSHMINVLSGWARSIAQHPLGDVDAADPADPSWPSGATRSDPAAAPWGGGGGAATAGHRPQQQHHPTHPTPQQSRRRGSGAGDGGVGIASHPASYVSPDGRVPESSSPPSPSSSVGGLMHCDEMVQV